MDTWGHRGTWDIGALEDIGTLGDIRALGDTRILPQYYFSTRFQMWKVRNNITSSLMNAHNSLFTPKY